MKWRTDQPVSHVFPMSWISKLKKMTIKTKPKSAKNKQKSAPNSSLAVDTFRSPRFPNSGFGATGSISNLSFSPEILYNSAGREESDDELSLESREVVFELSSSTKEEVDCEFFESQKFSDMVSNIRKARDLSPELEEILSDIKGSEESTEAEERVIADRKLRDSNQRRKEIRMISSSDYRSTKPVQKTSDQISERTAQIIKEEILKLTPLDWRSLGGTEEYGSSSSISLKSRKSGWRTSEGDPEFAALNIRPEQRISDAARHDNVLLNLERKSKKDRMFKDLCSRSPKIKQRTKVRVRSPRIASKIDIRKMRALEELKTTRKNKKMGTNEGRDLDLESLAVVKSSFDPQKDFRDSMVEMISENGIRQPEELESLLACYLSLNLSKYHDVIIEVFRQVWFDLNGDRFPKRISSSTDSSTPRW